MKNYLREYQSQNDLHENQDSPQKYTAGTTFPIKFRNTAEFIDVVKILKSLFY